MKNTNKKIKTRNVRDNDLDALLDIEFDRYSWMYEEEPDKKAGIEDRFKKRIANAKDWMWVVEIDKKVCGFISGMPTDTEPEDFTSWEESTNNGTLDGKCIPGGKNVYVVNLDVKREAIKLNGQYMIMAQLGAKAIRMGKEKVIFESRMPGFRKWVFKESGIGESAWKMYEKVKQFEVSTEYSKLEVERKGKRVPKDRLLRFYSNSGFNLIKVFANAFEDAESLDFGMLCTGKNPAPRKLRIKPINFIVSKFFEKTCNNQLLFEKLIG